MTFIDLPQKTSNKKEHSTFQIYIAFFAKYIFIAF